MMSDEQLARAVLRVGDGRGFVVKHQNYRGGEERVVITAAHCLEHALLANKEEGLPPCHPQRYLEEETYRDLLAPLGCEPTVWATCLFVDPIADIAVLGPPDNQILADQAEAYDRLVGDMTTLVVADAPAQGSELLTFGEHEARNPTPGKGPARVLSLKGCWLGGQVTRLRGWLAFEPERHFVSGMSGSPIIDANGAAIGVCSTERANPVIVDRLSALLIQDIRAAQSENMRAGSGGNPVAFGSTDPTRVS
jgi:hypothetical protein